MKILSRIVLCIATAAVAISANAESFLVGVCTHPHEEGYGVSMLTSALKELGVTSYRSSISWEYVERTRGVYSIPENYRTTDEMLFKAKSLGIEPLVILDYGNPLYQSDGLVTTDTSRAAFAAYVRWMVARYKGHVRYYEIWNEWYIGMGSRDKPHKVPSVEDYIALLKVVYPIIRQEDPNAVVLGGGAGEGDSAWFKRFAELGGSQWVDGISIHPYNYGRGKGNNGPEASLAWVDEVHDIVTKAAHGEKRIYITEIGWPSHDIGYDEKVVAAYLSRYYLLARSKPYIAGVWWYDLYDDGSDPANREHNFGLLSRSMAQKPSFKALASIAPMLNGGNGFHARIDGSSVRLIDGDAGKKGPSVSWSAVAIPSRKANLLDFAGSAKSLLTNYDGRIPVVQDQSRFEQLAPESPVPIVLCSDGCKL